MHRRKSPPRDLSAEFFASPTATNDDHRRGAFKRKRLRPACWILIASLVSFTLLKLVVYRQPLSTTIHWDDFKQDYQRRYKRSPPESLKQWLDFAVSQNCETSKFYDSIDRDLKGFRQRQDKLHYNGLVEEAMNYSGYAVAFHIHDNKLTLVDWKQNFNKTWLKSFEAAHLRHSLRWLLRPLVHHKPPIDTTFVINLEDYPTNKTNTTFPIFSSCRESRHNDNLDYNTKTMTTPTAEETITTGDLVIPYYFSISTTARGLWFWPFYSRGPPWKQRKNTITWRGSTTGLGWEKSPRFTLVGQYGGVESIVNGVATDIAFVRVVQNYDGQALPSKYRRAEPMSYRDIQRNKFVIDVDGNAFTERFPKILRSGSLVFKSTKYREWFSERVQPFVDYIPVNYDLSDLVKKVEWANTHQSLAQSIMEHGRETVERHVRPEDQRCYTYRLMLEYHSLFES